MTLTAMPGLLAGQGSPYLNITPLLTTGKIFFVNSVVGRANNVGDDSLRPISTLQTAYNKCRADKGDYVVILPGHTENITAAAGINFNISGVTVVGFGYGADRPTFTLTTAAGASWDINAGSNVLAGVVIDATGVASVTAAMNVKAADFTYFNNTMRLANATNQAVLGILTTAAATRMTVMSSKFMDVTAATPFFTAGTTTAIRIVGGDGITIGDPDGYNEFLGAYSSGVGGIQGLTTDTSNLTVINNIIANYTSGATKAMVFTAASTGVFCNNRFSIGSGAAAVTGAAMFNAGGNYSGLVGVSAATLI